MCIKFRAAVLCGCRDMLKMGWNSTILFPGAISLISFYEHVLFILQNPHTKFCAAVASGCGKWVEIGLLYIWVMVHFLLLFLMNVFDLACEMHVQIFTRLCSVVAKLYQNGFKPFQASGKFFLFLFLFLFFIHLFTILMFLFYQQSTT